MQTLNVIIGIIKREIKNIVIYTTNKCNSKCKTCNIWKMQPKIDINPELINKILKDINKKVKIQITGGEFLLHPKYKEILKKLKGYNYTLFSNGILADKLIQTVREFKIKELLISCDGITSYNRIRGIDNINNIKKIINELRKETRIILNYTISPFNSKKDLLEVINFCNKKRVKLIIGVYNQPEYFNINTKFKQVYDLNDIKNKGFAIPKLLLNKYIKLYNKWLNKEYKIPCLNIRSNIVVYPNGNVSLCEGKQLIIGNLRKSILQEIWNSKKTINLQKKNKNCNCCFLTCQRPIDVLLNELKINKILK